MKSIINVDYISGRQEMSRIKKDVHAYRLKNQLISARDRDRVHATHYIILWLCASVVADNNKPKKTVHY